MHFPLRSMGAAPVSPKSRRRASPIRAAVAAAAELRPEAERIEIALPPPPSANNLFASSTRGGRFKSRNYAAWINEAGWRLSAQRAGRIVGHYEIEIHTPRRARRTDLDNLSKAISDLLVQHGIVSDDSLAERLTVSWLPAEATECVVILARAAAPVSPNEGMRS
jgi:Holliday junction resolvase RusA-like endonuclease